MKIRKPVNLAHPSKPVCEGELLSTDYLIPGMGNKFLQPYLLTTDTTTTANTVLAIEEYPAVGTVDCPSWKAAEETNQSELLVGPLTKQS